MRIKSVFLIISILAAIICEKFKITPNLTHICAGYWRLLEFNYHFRVLTYFLNLLNEQSWKPDQIPVSEVLDLLKDIVPMYVLEHLLSVYTEEISTSSTGTFTFCSQ